MAATDAGLNRSDGSRPDDSRPNGEEPGRLRVAQVVTSLAHGGAQETVLGTSRVPVERRGQVSVNVLAGGEQSQGPTLWDQPCLDGVGVVEVPSLVRSLSPLDDIRALRWLIRWLRTNRPDVVHTHSSKAGVLGRLAAFVVGIPVVHTVHGWGSTPVSGRVARFAVVGLERALARITARLVVVGESDRTQGLEWGVGSPAKYDLIRSGISLVDSAATAAELRSRMRRQLDVDDRLVVGMVARFSRQKDHETLLRSLAEVARTDLGPSLTLLLVGEGSTRDEIEATINDLGLRDHVRLLGHRPDAALVVHAFDISVTSSRWEGLPRTVLEAAAAGVPVVATDVGSVGDFIEHEHNGLLVAPGSVSGLAEAIVRLGLDHRLRSRLADAAWLRVRSFSDEEMRDRTLRLWFDVARSGSGR